MEVQRHRIIVMLPRMARRSAADTLHALVARLDRERGTVRGEVRRDSAPLGRQVVLVGECGIEVGDLARPAVLLDDGRDGRYPMRELPNQEAALLR